MIAKRDSIVLQLADMCAFVLRAAMEGRQGCEELFQIFTKNNAAKMPKVQKILRVFTRCVLATLCRRELRRPTNDAIFSNMAEVDESQEALRNVERITESEPVNGEDLVESEDLKRKFREAKKRLSDESSEKPVE
jgi:hypothetical protein